MKVKSKLQFRAGFSYPEELREVVTKLAEENKLSSTVCKLMADKYNIKLEPPKPRKEPYHKRRRF